MGTRRKETLRAKLIAWAKGVGREFTLGEAMDQHVKHGGADPRARKQSTCDDIKFLRYEPGMVRVKEGPHGGRFTRPTVWKYSAAEEARVREHWAKDAANVPSSLWDEV